MRSDEVWHSYDGAPLTLHLLGERGLETVAPGFDFSDWVMPPRATLLARYPEHAELICQRSYPG